MKKILAVVLSLSITNVVFAQSCFEMYQTRAAKKIEIRQATSQSLMQEAHSYGPWTAGAAVTSFFVPALVPYAIGLAAWQAGYYATAYAFNLASLVKTKEARVSEYGSYAEETKGHMKRTLKAAKRKNPNATMDDVVAIIETGFESGDFCLHRKFFGPKQIRKYVVENI
jgi:hypothetical protein